MAIESQVVRLELDPEGSGLARHFGGSKQYVLLAPELKHGTARRVEAVNRKYLHYSVPSVKVEEGQTLSEAAKNVAVELDLNADFTEANDILLLGQVEEWTFGPVNQEVLDGLPEKTRDLILQKCDELYTKSPLPGSGGKG